jgi:hypothetical protein
MPLAESSKKGQLFSPNPGFSQFPSNRFSPSKNRERPCGFSAQPQGPWSWAAAAGVSQRAWVSAIGGRSLWLQWRGRIAEFIFEVGREMMATVKRKYDKEEFARRGDAIYENDVQPKLSPKDNGKFVAIDIDTGEYEIHKNEMTAGDRLRERLPEAQIWMVRVGSRYVHRFGGRLRQESQ